ncbi:LysR family transcriptional regulator [Sphingomonas sp. PL-96]|uniref:LysR family transcriptional regulator n=1 Tax=Sphingomonas sp. PL-96 TaxID=2887201 RepID=UPI001E37DBF0|nr:LysR family transcriptional regulator [Sphingomonas sp. PL-96]MCC2976734.1 LysR family transcriptional regulator [Sphingomonas sp. PL-96]
MKLHHLSHFIAVAAHGSLHRASASIGIAQSALSRSLSELEASLGTVLLERGRRGTVLTAAGERFLVRARVIQEELRRSREEAGQHDGGHDGHVTVAMSPTAQMLILPAVMRRFRRNWPHVQVTVLDGLAEAFEASLLDGTVDFYVGICPLRSLDRSIAQSDLTAIGRIVVSKANSKWQAASSLADLAKAPWIRIRSDDRADELSEAYQATGLPVPGSIYSATSMLTVLLLLQSIDAVALVPSSWADVQPAAGAFEQVPVQDTLGSLDLCVMRRSAIPLTPAAQSMLDLVVTISSPAVP